MNQQTVVCQGTFDPITNGHLAIVKNARRLFERVVVLLLVNPAKKPLFCVEERKALIEEALKRENIQNLTVYYDDGLLADYMQKKGLTVCVRGVRNGRDCEFELENHRLSRAFFPSLQTVLLPCEPTWADVSSSAVKAACAAGRLPAAWVPANVAEALKKKYPALQIF